MKNDTDENFGLPEQDNWLERMADAEDEYGDIRIGYFPPCPFPIEPVLEDEATIRKKLADIMATMRQKEAARKEYLQSMRQKMAQGQDAVNV